jgi:ribonucleotide monophosphatase NagD (HAD superfamily)
VSATKETDCLSAVRGYLIDLDGTLYVGDRLVDGAIEFVHRLQECEIPHESDVGGAQNVGITGILVLSGKTTDRPRADANVQADSVLESVADLLEVL